MDTGTAITGLVLIAIIVVPFLLLNISTKVKNKRMLSLLNTEAERLGCTINEYELSGNAIIGIDDDAEMVFFGKTKGGSDLSQTVNLADFQSCEIVAKNRYRGEEANNDRIVDKLELYFKSKTPGKGDISLEFYCGAENFQLNDELSVMKKWTKIINNKLPVKV
jgi:hypothetical protein